MMEVEIVAMLVLEGGRCGEATGIHARFHPFKGDALGEDHKLAVYAAGVWRLHSRGNQFECAARAAVIGSRVSADTSHCVERPRRARTCLPSSTAVSRASLAESCARSAAGCQR